MLALGDIFWAAIATATATGVPATLGAVAAIKASRHSKEAARHACEVNEAVNHRHPEEPRLLDYVRDTHTRVVRTEGRLNDHIDWHLERG